MSKKYQIGYSLSLWETLKEYNEETKWFEPTKNKKVEVAQMLSDELSDDEEVKSLLIDKLFGYKDNIKEMIMKSDYIDIPSYHKESLEKDQKISDLEAKLAEKEHTINTLIEDHKASQEWYKKQLAEKEKELTYIVMKYNHSQGLLCDVTRNNQGKISFAVEQLEKVKEHNDNLFCDDEDYYNYITEFIDNQIKQLKEGN